jgi:formamidopyrimidine-DNA glycosylase
MPELPEVETIRRDLEILHQQKIIAIYRSDKKMRLDSSVDLQKLVNAKINQINRQARYLLIDLDNKHTLIIHLGMSGRLSIVNKFSQLKHDHFACQISDQQWLVFNDPRRFGFIDLIENKNLPQHKMLAKLAVEPLSEQFNFQYLKAKLANKTLNIKTAIMDNKIVVGVGNIYASESLFDAKISPIRSANSLKDSELKKLVASIKKIISNAIEQKGSSISDYYDAKGNLGNFQNNHLVYDKANQPCRVCDNEIIRIVQNARASFYCQKCQK